MSTAKRSVDSGKSSSHRCSACGEPIENTLADGRCRLCGHRIVSAPVTSEDSTPYAQAELPRLRGWLAMCLWVYAAGSQRLAHLSLMRRSGASTRFVRISLLAFALAAALFALPHFGWRVVSVDPSMESNVPTSPSGKGWICVVSLPPEHPLRHGRLTPVAVWWNLAQAAIAVPATFASALLVGWLVLAIVSSGVERSLTSRFRNQGRFGAALRYSSGWVLCWLVGGAVSLLLTPGNVKDVTHWSFVPPRISVYLAAAVVTSVGLLMWWFWLIRAGSSAPPATRTRVVLFFALWTPLLVAAIVALWIAGLFFGMQRLAPLLYVQW